ncbi:uncharacterized protein LOC141641717 [Silene latifolia]|uniref:uncharacterized protein LOC141641717 n=1 Tax=Silene latifolia TaxID=37657 RepID=UPI003D76AB4C
MCKGFGSTLSGAALQWFVGLPNKSISSFADLVNAFNQQFASSRKPEKQTSDLYRIVQGFEESTRDYLNRFNKEKVSIPRCDIATAIQAFRRGLHQDSQLYKELTMHPCTTFEEVQSKAIAVMRPGRRLCTLEKKSERSKPYSRSVNKVSGNSEGKSEADLPPKVSEYGFTTNLAGLFKALKELGRRALDPRDESNSLNVPPMPEVSNTLGVQEIRGDQEEAKDCYKVALKPTTGSTYQRLVNMMFKEQIGQTMEVYIDDMVVKSKQASQHHQHLAETFNTLRKYQMKLNPTKCTFGVSSGKFLGYMVTQRGIEASTEQIRAILQLESPQKPKDVQRLTGRVAALNRFISRSSDRCRLFYDVLRKSQRFEWTDDHEKAFQELKRYLSTPPLLSKPEPGEPLFLYLSVTEAAVSAVLVREQEGSQHPVYYISKSLLPAETGRDQTQAEQDILNLEEDKGEQVWELHVDGASNAKGAGVGLVLKSPQGDLIVQALIVNHVNDCYEARDPRMMAYLDVAKELKIRFVTFNIKQIPREQNAEADALATLGATFKTGTISTIPIVHVREPATLKSQQEAEKVCSTSSEENTPDWRKPYLDWLQNDVLPADKKEVRSFKMRASRFILIDDVLFRNPHWTLPRMPGSGRVSVVLHALHSGECGNHAGAGDVQQGTEAGIRPTMRKDAMEFAKRCDACGGTPITTPKVATGQTPFSLVFGVEAVIPSEVRVPTHRYGCITEDRNQVEMASSLDTIDELRTNAQIRMSSYRQTVARSYNKNVKVRTLQVGDLVLRKVFQNTKNQQAGKFAYNWEGPY